MSPLDYRLIQLVEDDATARPVEPGMRDCLDRLFDGGLHRDWPDEPPVRDDLRRLAIGAVKCLGAWLTLCAVFALIALVAGA